MTVICSIVMFELLEAERDYGAELDIIIGVGSGKQRLLQEEELAFIGMAVKTSLCIPRFQS